MTTKIAAYEMNPAEDTLKYGDELREGMWVLPEDRHMRPGVEASEDAQLRGQRFCKVTRLRDVGDGITFIGEWIDGYQSTFGRPKIHKNYAWIVKKDPIAADDTNYFTRGQ
jgi:hypothetical protein